MKTLRKTAELKHLRHATPLLDMDADTGDAYLAELASRVSAARYDASRRDAVTNWVN